MSSNYRFPFYVPACLPALRKIKSSFAPPSLARNKSNAQGAYGLLALGNSLIAQGNMRVSVQRFFMQRC